VNLGIDAIHAYLEGNGNSFEITLQRTFKDHLGFVLAKKNKIVLRIYMSPSALRHQSVTSPFQHTQKGSKFIPTIPTFDILGWFWMVHNIPGTRNDPIHPPAESSVSASSLAPRATSLPPRDFGCLLGTRFMCCRLKVNAMVRECRPFRGSVKPAMTDSDARKAEHGDSALFNGINTII